MMNLTKTFCRNKSLMKCWTKPWTISNTIWNQRNKLKLKHRKPNQINFKIMKKLRNSNRVIHPITSPWISQKSKNANNFSEKMENSIGDASAENRRNNTWKPRLFANSMTKSGKDKSRKNSKEKRTSPQSNFIWNVWSSIWLSKRTTSWEEPLKKMPRGK